MDKLDEMEERYRRIEEGEEVASQPSQAPFRPGEKVTHTVTVPEPTDPRLWCVKTFGPERELCISLMWKSFESMRDGKEVPIHSVFFGTHLRGYIYIEAHRENDVKDFIRGIKGMSAMGGFALVPNTQMPMVFTASQADARNSSLIQVGDWVRLKRGLYGGDLAQVEEVHDGGIYMLKIKPRIAQGSDLKTALKNNKSKRRPVPRWFNRADIEAGQELLVNTELRKTNKGWKHFYVVDDETYRDGFLYKTFKSGWFIDGEAVRPQEYELQEWRNAPAISVNNRPERDLAKTKEEEEREQMPPPSAPLSLKKQAGERQQLCEGDPIIVISGDLKNLRGVITKALFGSPTVLIKPSNIPGIDGELSIAATRLCKYFEVGNYVKILSGPNVGDTGHITKVEVDNGGSWTPDTAARVISFSLSTEFRVRVDDMRLTVEKPQPKDRVGEFRVGQLVCIAGQNFTHAIIVRLEADSRAWVLAHDSKKLLVDFAEIEPVPTMIGYKKKVWSMDRKGHKVTPGCTVKAPRSLVARSAPIQAEVLFIYNSTLFVKATEVLTGERSFLACPADKCEFIYNRFDMPSRPPKDMKKTIQVQAPPEEIETRQLKYGITTASKVSFLQPGWFKQLGLPTDPRPASSEIPPHHVKRHTISKGDGVRIIGGGYKGLRGEIRDLLGDTVRISLLAKPKLIETSVNNVEKDDFVQTTKEQRWPECVPQTPRGEVGAAILPVSKDEQLEQVVSAEQQVVQALQEVGDMPTEEQSWNPAWLASTGLPSSNDTPLTAPMTPPILASVQPPSRSSARKKREPRIPGTASADVTPQTLPATPQFAPSTPLELGGSQLSAQDEATSNRSFNVSRKEGGSISPINNLPKAGPPWLMKGLGVQYKQGSETKCGWIVKVYANMAHVLPASERVASPLPFEDTEISPWPCTFRGDEVIVFDGPKRGVKGRVTGIQADNTVFIRSEKRSSTASILSGPMVRTTKKEVAKYCADPEAWVNAALAKAEPPQPGTQDQGPKAESNRDSVSDVEVASQMSQAAEDSPMEETLADQLQDGTQKGAAPRDDDTSMTPFPSSDIPSHGAMPVNKSAPSTPVLLKAEKTLLAGSSGDDERPLDGAGAAAVAADVDMVLEAPVDAAGTAEDEMMDDAPLLGSSGGGQTLLDSAGTDAGAPNENIKEAPVDAAGTAEDEMMDDAPLLGSSGSGQTLLGSAGTNAGTPNENIKEAPVDGAGGGGQTLLDSAGTDAETPKAALGDDQQPPSPADGKSPAAAAAAAAAADKSEGSQNAGDQSSSSAGPVKTRTPETEPAQKSSGSQYKIIGGVRYERNLLEQAEKAGKNGRISVAEAKQLWEMAMEGGRVTDVERRTLEHIVNEMNCTVPAASFLKKKIAEEQKKTQARALD
eukprot:TRINITY_DN8337_c0_g1_i1.p1 TRINITY_DN8337_c0_g1~~TRINITY_DN8337_c0_g1_i1.p1  ORF type:complete len:1569 (-),score=350.11 TRINITY_DN8337_c0_g1_i1:212-4381(-)